MKMEDTTMAKYLYDKVVALQALANDPNATEHERHTAAVKAQELLTELLAGHPVPYR
jgi:hypothetical protein